MMRHALVLAALAVVAGCASEPAPAPVAVAQAATGTPAADPNSGEGKQVCVRERPMGSDIPVTRCHTEPSAIVKGIALDNLRNSVNQSTRPTVPAGGGH
jgi:hypothetical protein